MDAGEVQGLDSEVALTAGSGIAVILGRAERKRSTPKGSLRAPRQFPQFAGIRRQSFHAEPLRPRRIAVHWTAADRQPMTDLRKGGTARQLVALHASKRRVGCPISDVRQRPSSEPTTRPGEPSLSVESLRADV